MVVAENELLCKVLRTVTPVIVTNSDAFEHISMEEKQKVTCQDVILEIK